MIPLAAAFAAGFLVCAGYSIRKVRQLRRRIVADRAAALRQSVWRAGREAEMPLVVSPVAAGCGDLFYDGSVDRWWLLTANEGWLQLPECFFPARSAA